MRICLVSQEYPPETAKGGLGTQTYLKATGLASVGHEVFVVSASPTGDPSAKDVDGVHVVRIGSLHERVPLYTEAAQWIAHSTEVAAAVWELHQEYSLDIVEFPEWGAEGFTHLLNRTQWNNIPTVVQLHGPLVMLAHTVNWPDRESEFYRVGTFMEATCVRLADAVFSSSACSADWCAKHYGIHRDEVPVLHTGVDTKHFHPAGTAKAEQPTIIFAGRVAQNKGVEELVDAMAKLPGVQLWILGRGDEPYVNNLKARATDAVKFVGYVERAELPGWLSRADVFCGPSHFEGGPGLAYLEAMACGLPVVAGDQGGAGEVVLPGLNGFLVAPRSADALVDVLEPLLADRQRCALLGRQARDYVLENADSDKCLRQLEQFYLGVLKR
jgi:glycogen(starch) synthase